MDTIFEGENDKKSGLKIAKKYDFLVKNNSKIRRGR